MKEILLLGLKEVGGSLVAVLMLMVIPLVFFGLPFLPAIIFFNIFPTPPNLYITIAAGIIQIFWLAFTAGLFAKMEGR